MADPPTEATPPPPLAKRLQPWVDVASRLLAAIASALAIWKGLG
jgi:hypothetical protein